MSICVIISTYNWSEALKLSLLSLANQQILPNEVIIADDGSDEKTRLMLDDIAKVLPYPLVHCWQENKGFRVGRIRNEAIKCCSQAYIIQIDGDIICHPLFIADHLRYQQKGYFICGRRVNLNEEETRLTIAEGKLFAEKSITENKASAAKRIPFLMQLFKIDAINRYINKGVYGCNVAYWKADALEVNGYNLDMEGWGREDDEFVQRLINAKKYKKTLKFGGIVYHLFHAKRATDSFQKNDAILQNTLQNRITYTPNGIKQS